MRSGVLADLGMGKSASHQALWVFALKYIRIGDITRRHRDDEEPMLIQGVDFILGKEEFVLYLFHS
jgi:hypothetical protein